jgi:predicted nucleic acid-binding protein
MARPERRYTLDTQLFIRGYRDAQARVDLEAFHSAFAPFEYLSAVVVHELRAGATVAEARELERHLVGPFERRGRLLTPSYDAWKRAADVLARLRESEGLELRAVSRGFAADVLLAASCRESGVILVTANVRDFERIARVQPFDYSVPWPKPVT